jgi:hypothetical protein
MRKLHHCQFGAVTFVGGGNDDENDDDEKVGPNGLVSCQKESNRINNILFAAVDPDIGAYARPISTYAHHRTCTSCSISRSGARQMQWYTWSFFLLSFVYQIELS